MIDCSEGHTLTSWTTGERTNDAGERCFYFERHCTLCPFVEETSAAITEPTEPRHYAKCQEDQSEPDD